MDYQDRMSERLGQRVSRAMLNADNKLTEPNHEAAFFYGLFLRGYPLEKLRADIDVPPHILERMQRLSLTDPWYQTTVDRILNYRKEVLAIFDSLVFRQMETPARLH